MLVAKARTTSLLPREPAGDGHDRHGHLLEGRVRACYNREFGRRP
jgi:hypothetical protein